jgi:peptidoglycan/LPS O-acetylase OafA/YrhL
MLYHGELLWLPGGFLGVDVFFVLSGFLITSLLVTEWRAWGSLDLLAFWGRRARRLLPALFLVIAAVGIYAALAVDDSRKSALRADTWATLLYVANWRFGYSGQSYFDRFSEPSPLLHMWSLGIEEQFYWLFPLLLMVWFWLRRTTRGLALLLAAAAVGSALLMALRYEPATDPSRLYFGTDTRAQGLLVGAALAVWVVRRKPAEARPRKALAVGPVMLELTARTWVGLACLGLLAVTFTVVNESDPWLYRGGFLAIAVVTAGVIFAGASEDRTTTQRILSVEPLRRIGLISYGLYLWHWPVFIALSPTRTGLAPLPLTLARFATTFALAFVSYRLVELPIRQGVLRRRLLPVPRRVFVASGLAAVVAVVLVGTAGAVSSPTPLGGDPSALRAAATGQRSVLVAGDSTATTLGWYFPAAQYPDLAVSQVTEEGCGLPEQIVVVGDTITRAQPHCASWPTRFSAASDKVKPDLVVLATGTWEVYDHQVDGRILRVGTEAYAHELETRYDQAIDALAGTGRPVALLNVPCLRQESFAVQGVDLANDRNDPARQQWVNGVLARVAARHPGQVHVLDLRGLLCPADRYSPVVGGVTVRPDGVHVGESGGVVVWNWLAPQLRRLIRDAHQQTAFLVGDSMALNLRLNFPAIAQPGLRVTGSTTLGCGLTPAPLSYRGVAKPLDPACPKWSRGWPAEVDLSRPDVGLVMAGIHEQWDHVVDGTTVQFGTDAYRQHIYSVLDTSVDPFRRRGTVVALSTVPCHRVHDDGTSPDGRVINDQQRVHWINGVLRDYARERKVALVDLYGFLCAQGYQEARNGVKLRTDGMHFTPQGARIVWDWLGPQLAALARSAQSRGAS